MVEFHSPRACAYALLGIQEYLHSYPGDRDAQRVRFALAQRLLDMYESIQRPDWKWFEDVVAYGNARLPQAMLLVGSACANERMLSAGLDSLDWLMETQRCPDERPLCARSARKGFTARAANKLDSINSRLKPPARCPLVCRPIA